MLSVFFSWSRESNPQHIRKNVLLTFTCTCHILSLCLEDLRVFNLDEMLVRLVKRHSLRMSFAAYICGCKSSVVWNLEDSAGLVTTTQQFAHGWRLQLHWTAFPPVLWFEYSRYCTPWFHFAVTSCLQTCSHFFGGGDLNDVAFLEYTSGSTGNPKCVATVQWRFSAVLNEPSDEHVALAFTPQVDCTGQNHSHSLVGLAGCIHAFSSAANQERIRKLQKFNLLDSFPSEALRTGPDFTPSIFHLGKPVFCLHWLGWWCFWGVSKTKPVILYMPTML